MRNHLPGENIHPYTPRILQILIFVFHFFIYFVLFFLFFSFSLINTCLPNPLRYVYAVLWVKNRFVGLETRKHNDQFWKFKFNIEYFPRNSNYFDGPSNYLYQFKNNQKTFSFSWPGERPSSHLKVTKMRFGPNIKYFSELSLRIFAAAEGGRHLLLFTNVGIIIFVNVILKKIKIIFINNYLHCCKTPVGCSSSSSSISDYANIVENTSSQH